MDLIGALLCCSALGGARRLLSELYDLQIDEELNSNPLFNELINAIRSATVGVRRSIFFDL